MPSCTYHHFFTVHPNYSRCQHFLLSSWLSGISLHAYTTFYLDALIHLWTLGLCQPFGYYDKAVINIYIQVLCGYMLLFLLAIYLGVLLSHMIHLFDCMKNFQTFQSDCSIHISTSRVWGFQFLRIPINTGYYWIFFVLTIVTAACN